MTRCLVSSLAFPDYQRALTALQGVPHTSFPLATRNATPRESAEVRKILYFK